MVKSLRQDTTTARASPPPRARGKGDEALDKEFVAEAKKQNLHNLGGHRSIGGMRASIYNAMPEEGIDKLIVFMKEFEKAHA